MFMFKRSLMIIVILLISILLISGVATAKTFRMASGVSEDTPNGQALEYFANRFSELTNGEYNIKVFHGGTLGDGEKTAEQVLTGTIEFCRESTAFLSSFVPILDVFSVPYLFRDSKHYWKVLNDPISDEIAAHLEDSGFKFLFWIDAGARSVINSKRPIKEPKDLKGLKIRVMPSDVMIKAFKLLGASPVAVAYEENYSALQTGVVDAAENHPINILSMSFQEVTKYLSMTEHMRIPDMAFMNLDLYNSFSQDVKDALHQAANEAEIYMRGQWDRNELYAIDQLRDSLEINEIENLEKFIEAVSTLHEELDPKFDGYISKIKAIK